MADMTLVFRTANPATPTTTPTIKPTHQENGVLKKRTYVVRRYQTCRLGSRLWDCVACGQRAANLFHVAVSLLTTAGSTSTDCLVPSCRSVQCSKKAYSKADEFGKSGLPGKRPVECQNCGSESRATLCGSCTFSQNAQRGSELAIQRSRKKRVRRESRF